MVNIVGTLSVMPEDAPKPLLAETLGMYTLVASERTALAFLISSCAALTRRLFWSASATAVVKDI